MCVCVRAFVCVYIYICSVCGGMRILTTERERDAYTARKLGLIGAAAARACAGDEGMMCHGFRV